VSAPTDSHRGDKVAAEPPSGLNDELSVRSYGWKISWVAARLGIALNDIKINAEGVATVTIANLADMRPSDIKALEAYLVSLGAKSAVLKTRAVFDKTMEAMLLNRAETLTKTFGGTVVRVPKMGDYRPFNTFEIRIPSLAPEE
jgi:hypothetical protein